MRRYGQWLFGMVLLLICVGGVAWAQGSAGDEGASPAAADAPAADAGAAAAQPATGDQAHELQLRQLEEKVSHIKEKIFRSKARLMLLQETILHGVIAGSKAVIRHTNDMGSGFRLDSVAYYLDGAPIFGKINIDGSLDTDKPIEIYNGTIQPGNHLLSVYMVYRGSSSVFVYVEGIQVKLKSSYSFKAEEGKITNIDVIGFDQGGVTAKFEDRPAVKFETKLTDIQEEDLPTGNEDEAGTGI